MLTPYLPFPLMSGGQTRSYNLIKNLSKKHEITLFSLIKDEREREHVKELQKFCKKVLVFKRSSSPWTLRNILLTGFGLYPFLVIRNLSSEEKKVIQKELSREKYDLIHAETFYVMPHIPETKIPVLLVEQTIEYLVYKHYVEEQAPLLMRPLFGIDIQKLKFWETYYWKKASKVVAMSDSDKEVMREFAPGLTINVVPNGIDTKFFGEKKKDEEVRPRILYVGNFSWLQNAEAVDVLVEKVWPGIKNKVKNSVLWIVGMNMTEHIKSLKGKDILVNEGIPDIRDAYSKATVLVAPIKGPGGTRLKILEAMASSLPVVTTSVGAEGLGLKNRKEAIIKDDFQELSEAAIEVIKSPSLREKLQKEGRKFVHDNYTWEKSAELLDKLYKKVVYGQKN